MNVAEAMMKAIQEQVERDRQALRCCPLLQTMQQEPREGAVTVG